MPETEHQAAREGTFTPSVKATLRLQKIGFGNTCAPALTGAADLERTALNPKRQSALLICYRIVLCEKPIPTFRTMIQRGRTLDPISIVSTACAHWRPSRIAQTTRLCPRRMSPHEKICPSLVW